MGQQVQALTHLTVVLAVQLASQQATATQSRYRDLLSTQQVELREHQRGELPVPAGMLLWAVKYP
jgi:hypothetical protein